MGGSTVYVVYLLGILLGPALVALCLVLFRRQLVFVAGHLAGGAALLSLVTTALLVPELQRGGEPRLSLAWIPVAGIELGMHVDWLALPFLLTETAVTLLAIVYAWGYHHADRRTPYFYALLLFFSVGMSGTTLADDMVLFYTFWELMLVASTVLILVWGEVRPEGPTRRHVAFKYFIFTHVGSLLVLAALLLLYNAADRDTFSALRGALALDSALVPVIVALFLIGFGVKMAVFPVHVWLPDAHTIAPMPVTIMLAAAMLSMGTYGILRFPLSLFSPGQLAPFALPVMIAGVVSEIYGALMALAERDIKRIIAYSSVSQMGYILFGLGTLTFDGLAGATLHVITHAIVKALLFMVAGLVIYATGRRRIDQLGGLAGAAPVATAAGAVGLLAIAGTPPLCIFDSEWMLFSGGFQTPHTALAVAAVCGSFLTVVYAFWLGGRIFFGPRVRDLTIRRVPWTMAGPALLLAVLTVVEGILPAPIFSWVSQELPLLLGGGG